MAAGLIGILALGGLLGAGPGIVNFDASQTGVAPPNWSIASSAAGGSPWLVRSDSSAPSRGNVLESSPRGEESPLAVFDSVVCKDGEVGVKFRIDPKASGGTAGLIWRYQDDRNYYLLDFDSTRHTISLFRVKDGVRRPVPDRTGKPKVVAHDIRAGEWHVAKVSFRGSGIKVYFGNRRLFEADDSGLRAAGKAGVVTSGTTVAAFDDFRIDKKS